ncbi:hypothetical protein A9Q81_20520 [Gammaproteobacteria bacterium 42_54_T18]|nr:hypothetical protein A9Q81_20520 [Gammaproteobacteria bacterium 42_54_T18]
MDFNLSSEQKMLGDSAKRYLSQNYSFDIYLDQIGSNMQINPERWQKMLDLGWFGLPFSEENGGFSGSLFDVSLIARALGEALSIDPYVDNIVLPGKLLEFISSPTADAWLKKLIDGERTFSAAIYDVDSHYDINHTNVILEDGVVNGQKSFVSNVGEVDYLICYAREASDEQPILFIVAVEEEGVEYKDCRVLNGSRSGVVTFNNLELTNDKILCVGSDATAAAQRAIDYVTVLECAAMIGAATAAYEKTLEYAKIRKQFGTHIGSFQVIQHYLVDMFVELQQAESMLFMATDKGAVKDVAESQAAISSCKAYLCKSVVAIAQQAIQIHGGIGVTEELDIGHYFRFITHLSLIHGDRDFHMSRYMKRTGLEDKICAVNMA